MENCASENRARIITNNLPCRGECVNHSKQWVLHKFWPRSQKAFKKVSLSSAVLNAGWSFDGNGPVLKLCKGRIHPLNKVIRKIFGAFGSLTRRLKKDTGPGLKPQFLVNVYSAGSFTGGRHETRTFPDVKRHTMCIINTFFFRDVIGTIIYLHILQKMRLLVFSMAIVKIIRR